MEACLMFEQEHSEPSSRQQVSTCDDTGKISSTLAQACADLSEALWEMTARQHALDDERMAVSEADASNALNAVWIARQNCDRIAVAVQKAHPTTKSEAAAQRSALAAYVGLADLSEFMRQSILERDLLEGSGSGPGL